ncbi:TIGR02391 family protein [Mycobacterium sp. NPDC050551]|uniref:TIGR02391 family protein n=1 Tax=Mycobacterium sp. NPDC050551 TaxID=3155407 RepID=UPI00343EA92D
MADPERNPTYLRELTGHVAEFRDAFTSFVELHTPTYRGPGIGMFPAISPLEGVDLADLQARRERVSIAAGRARNAPRLTGCVFGVVDHQGAQNVVDPIAAWNTVTQPKPMLEPANVVDACNQMIGSLEDLAACAEAEHPPTVNVAEMHPAVWGQSARLWRDGHYRQAVAAAADGVVQLVKSRTARTDIDDTPLWQQAFSNYDPEPGKPRLRWPGDQTDRTVVSMNNGLRQFAPGAQMTIRNPAAHGLGELTQQEAIERLSVLSLLARWVDQCDLIEAPDDPTTTGTP